MINEAVPGTLIDILRRCSTSELKVLRKFLDNEIDNRVRQQRLLAQGQKVIEERLAGKMTLRLMKVKCSKPKCTVCAEGKGHGPYWYGFWKENGKTRTMYIGKDLGKTKRG